MKLGLISDIHAQLAPLERALALLTALRVDKILCAGDLVEKGPDGDAVVSLLSQSLIPCVMGNHDQNAVAHAALPDALKPDDEAALAPETTAWLATLPETWSWWWEGQVVMMAHASPTSLRARIGPEPDRIPKRFRRWARSSGVDVLILGHTHAPMQLEYGDMTLINPGSVACTRPRDSGTCGVLTLPSRRLELYTLT